jgi:hypothetical protein
MTLSRRTLLLGIIPSAMALAGCARGDTPVQISAGTNEPAPAVTQPAAGATPRASLPPLLRLPPDPVPQGGAIPATLSGDSLINVTAEFLGRRFRVVEERGSFLAFIPAGQLIGDTQQVPPGVYPLAMNYEIVGLPMPRTLEGSVTISATDFPVEMLTFTPQVASLLDPTRVEQETAIMKAAYGGFSPVRYWDGPFLRPSPADVSDVYGSRRSYQGGPVTGSHAGVDFAANVGAPVVAAAHGRVELAQMMPVRGNMVILDHGAGVFTGYCHLASFSVMPGQEVRGGEQIGLTGATGLVTGPHLHWEVVVGGMHVDGLQWLST